MGDKKRYRVGIDGHMIGDNSGGNENYYSNLLDHLNWPEEWTVYLFLMPEVDDSRWRDRYHIIRYKSQNAFQRVFLENSKLCKSLHMDLLHVQYFIPLIHPKNCKIACMIHDICFEHYKDIFTKKEYYKQKLLIPYSAKHADLIFTDSLDSRNDLVKTYNLFPDKIVVTYAGVSDKFKKLDSDTLNAAELRKKYGISAVKPYILTVGNLQPRKNLERLIKAYRKIRTTGVDVQLVIVGKKAWMFNSIIQEALGSSTGARRDSAGGNDIIFTSYVDEDDLVRLYNAATIFIYPSFFEGFGLPPLEAMACGTPVAASNITSLPEVVGNAGVFFDPFSVDGITGAMDRMLKDETLRQELSRKGLEQAKVFNWKRTADIVTNTYKAMLARNASDAGNASDRS